jgi:LmbE family N-acetylglucosaminyl deacetylase
MSNILVIAAHPDDEVLGCGGTIAKLAADGDRVEILILGEGATSRNGSDDSEVQRLQDDARKAASVLGAANVRFASLPDNRFDTVPLLDVVQQIEAVVAEVKPDVVFTQHGGDLNVDHQITFRAVMTALRPMEGQGIRALYAYEVASSTEWAFQKFDPVFRPNYFVNIDGFFEQKILAMEAYGGEIRPAPHPRSPEVLQALAVTRGAAVGLKAAEAFEIIWRID